MMETGGERDSYVPEEKKSFWLIYSLVALFYAIMIIVYSFVIHSYTINHQADMVTPDYTTCPDYVPPIATSMYNAAKVLVNKFSEMNFLQA